MNDQPHANPDTAQQSVVVELAKDNPSGVSTVEFGQLFEDSSSLLTRRLLELLPVAVYICEAPLRGHYLL
jgi:hypothetical protein